MTNKFGCLMLFVGRDLESHGYGVVNKTEENHSCGRRAIHGRG